MFHDLCLSKNYALRNYSSAVKYNQQKEAAVWGFASEFLEGIAPHVFYFDYNDIDENLLDTARDFFHEEVLHLPFEECCFIFDNSIETPDERTVKQAAASGCRLTDKLREAYILRKTASLSPAIRDYLNLKDLSFDSEYCFMKFSEFIVGNEIAAGIDMCIVFLSQPGISMPNGIIGTYPLIPLEPFQIEIANKNNGRSFGTILSAMLLLNTKYAGKEEHLINPKLNKARAKRGKEALRNYTTIKLNIDRGAQAGTGTHSSPRPHWRRGHIRRLPSGLKTAVQPCIVNFDGKEVQPKLYKVET